MAAKHVDDFYPSYADAPRALEKLDQYGVMPFVRYGSKVIGLYANLHATPPGAMQVLRQGFRHVYENADEDTRERLELGVPSAAGRNVPIDPIARKFGVEEPVDLNARWLSPLPTPADALGIQRGGSFGADLYDTRLKAVPEGPVPAIPLEFLSGRSLEFQRELSDEEQVKTSSTR